MDNILGPFVVSGATSIEHRDASRDEIDIKIRRNVCRNHQVRRPRQEPVAHCCLKLRTAPSPKAVTARSVVLAPQDLGRGPDQARGYSTTSTSILLLASPVDFDHSYPPTSQPQPRTRLSVPLRQDTIRAFPRPFLPIFTDPGAQLPNFPSSHRWSALTGTVERERGSYSHGGGGKRNRRPNMQYPKRILLVHLYLDHSLLQRLLQC